MFALGFLGFGVIFLACGVAAIVAFFGILIGTVVQHNRKQNAKTCKTRSAVDYATRVGMCDPT